VLDALQVPASPYSTHEARESSAVAPFHHMGVTADRNRRRPQARADAKEPLLWQQQICGGECSSRQELYGLGPSGPL
jgi:hypothetical protein